ncbi:MAG: type IV pilus modification PilV family protein [Planctomycetota bacterium]|jgi:prepilin-type N-terminal cleavage/methylation domain-containing protein
MNTRAQEGGFTLLESLIALSILAAVVMHFLGSRTSALIDAAEARNWRLAREIASSKISEIKAGANEFPPENGVMIDHEEYTDFRWKVVIGEQAISDLEAELAEEFDDFADPDSNARHADRNAWDQERAQIRRAQSMGMSMTEYNDHMLEEELEDKAPSEAELEDVMLVVYFPNIRPSDSDSREESTFTLKAKISTMALDGLTPEEAREIAIRKGVEFTENHRPPGAPVETPPEGTTPGGN